MSQILRHAGRTTAFRSLSLRFFSSTKTDVEEKKAELDFKTFNLTPRTVQKAPALPPLMKEFFVGEIHEGYFPFLEVVEKEHLDEFFKDQKFKSKYFGKQVQANIENLKQLGHYGIDVPQEYRGRGYSVTETALNAEIEAQSSRASHILNPHRLVTQAIVEFGTDQQKERYLRKLVDGELIGTVAIFENEGSEDEPFRTKATPTNTGFILNGEKNFVMNSNKANLILVLASSSQKIHSHDKRVGVSAFLVDGNEPGIVRGQLLKTLGNDDVEQGSLTFTETTLKTENVLGEVNNAQPIAMKLLQMGRLQSSIIALELNKKIINNFTKYCIETNTLGGKPKDWEMHQVRLGRAVSEIYAAESMIYFTTSLMDAYEGQDVHLEAAASKLFVMESLLRNAEIPFWAMGPKSTVDENATNIRDAVQIFAQGECLDTLKLFIGLCGIEHSSEDFADAVDKNRNPAMHPEGFFRNMFRGRPFDSIKVTKNYIRFLHPSLNPAAEMLEKCLKRFKMAIEFSLTRHGRNILEAQTEVARLARCATLLYSVMATVSRASRSYCIGLRFADVEILQANTYALEAMKEIKRITDDLEEGENSTNDLNHKTISRQLFESKGYYYQHPLVRAF